MKQKKYNRKNINLSGLYAVDSSTAYSKDKIKKGVYGIVGQDTPYVYKWTEKKDGTKQRKFIKDMTSIPDSCKNRIMAFYDTKGNSKKKCYLVDKSLYDEYISKKK